MTSITFKNIPNKRPSLYFKTSSAVIVLYLSGGSLATCEINGLTPGSMVSINLMNESNKLIRSFNAKKLEVMDMIVDPSGYFKFTFPNTLPTCQNTASQMFILNIISSIRTPHGFIKSSVVSAPFLVMSKLADRKGKFPTDVWPEFHQVSSSTTHSDFISTRSIRSVAKAAQHNPQNDRHLTQYFVETHALKKGAEKSFTLYSFVRQTNQGINLQYDAPDFAFSANSTRIEAHTKESINTKESNLGLINHLLNDQHTHTPHVLSHTTIDNLKNTLKLLVSELVTSGQVDLLDW
jgi:hypothetical protein